MTGYPVLDMSDVAQRQASSRPDLVPIDDDARQTLAHLDAVNAVIYGLPAAYQYVQMTRQYAEVGRATGIFVHERRLAAPGFAAFRVPNTDTLYSNAWLDLRGGPVRIDLPDFGDRYFTLNLLDVFGNAANLSRRTIGSARRVWLVSPAHDAGVPDGDVKIVAGSELMWVLMRIQVRSDVAAVHALQDEVAITQTGAGVEPEEVLDPERVMTEWADFFVALDRALSWGGIPAEDRTIVRRLGSLGLTGVSHFRPDDLDHATRAGMSSGFDEAMRVLDVCRPQLGEPLPTGWTKVCDKGAHGANHLSRAVMNHVGLAANVVEENTSFNTHVDGAGEPLDGAESSYVLRLETPPPAGSFWSVTLYDRDGFLVANTIDRYAVGSATEGLVVDDGGATEIAISANQPDGAGCGRVNWLPAPSGRFFLVLRIYQPLAAALQGLWLPSPVRRVA